MTRVHLCDYGVGNIHNVERALRRAGAEVISCSAPAKLENANALVIPGVGAFGHCITRFRDLGFERPVRDLINRGIPLLGICVGMQMLSSVSEEFGSSRGLDLIPGRVRRIPEVDTEGRPLKLPHIAWARLKKTKVCWADTPLERLEEQTDAYFVHSYAFECEDPDDVLATVQYGGHQLVAAVGRGQIFGTQFHPEKSAEPGLNVLRKFVELADA